ncbi:uncharacterized protein LOC107360689 [Tetranychus urticae]|uniref:F-box domain-containing protein n=1 Tax=Tetranychus urticae TaxID=32264 RepID=T1K4E5_TETUR|nr:uncharacterized protein LOC107360689 [Tetranychus urticae]
MLINELPDDCLLAIFDYIHILEDLINCFEVCEKWRNLIVGRTKRVKYVSVAWHCSSDSVFNRVNRPFDVTCLSKLFPNLRIFDFTNSFYLLSKVPIEDITKLIRDSESLKGIIWDKNLEFKIPQNSNLEMLSTGFINPNINSIYETVKQLNLCNFTLREFKEVAHCFPNLERLNIKSSEDTTDFSDGQVLENLKIVELADSNDTSCSFDFMDSCPALQSAYIEVNFVRFTCFYAKKHVNLQDLVLEFRVPNKWKDLSICISKYPNLKHLAIRNAYLRDEDIKQLILILPKLALLDVRATRGVTQEAADHVQDYCKQNGRSIKFYFKADDKQIESDWPQILNRLDKVCRGFDFMEHCFFRDFDFLPHLLDPIDD